MGQPLGHVNEMRVLSVGREGRGSRVPGMQLLQQGRQAGLLQVSSQSAPARRLGLQQDGSFSSAQAIECRS